MSILICTPCFGGQVTTHYFNSCIKLQENLLENGIDHSWLTCWNESLITRGRDKLAASFLKTEFEYLMFIDADIEFQWEDVAKLWNLEVPVSCGAYSMKRPDSPVSAWKDGQLVDLLKLSSPTPVDYAGTGFLMIHRDVFEKLKRDEWKYEDGFNGSDECWGFFQDPVKDGFKMSEDYFFCEEWRKLGGEIILDPSIKLGHWGSFRYG